MEFIVHAKKKAQTLKIRRLYTLGCLWHRPILQQSKQQRQQKQTTLEKEKNRISGYYIYHIYIYVYTHHIYVYTIYIHTIYIHHIYTTYV